MAWRFGRAAGKEATMKTVELADILHDVKTASANIAAAETSTKRSLVDGALTPEAEIESFLYMSYWYGGFRRTPKIRRLHELWNSDVGDMQ
jgi:hypothetical protein